MRRIDTTNAAMNLFGVGKHGFQGGNPATNTPATFFSPDWANAIQEELARAIEGLGVGLNPASSTQLLDAMLAYFTPKSQFSGEIGKISYVPATSASPNHLPGFGVEVSRAIYSELWAYAQGSGALVDDFTFLARPGCFSYGPGGVGGTTFRVPKIPGLVIKAYHNGDGTYTTDTSAQIGEYIPDQVLSHNHLIWGDQKQNFDGAGRLPTANQTSLEAWVTSENTGGSENTVRSVVLFPQIRAK